MREKENAMRRLLAWTSLVSLAAAGCAHTSSAPKAEQGAAPQKVVVTGSRIARTVDAHTGLAATISPVSIYTREQIDGTGRSYDTDAALRVLDPSFR